MQLFTIKTPARHGVAGRVDDYNRDRRHTALGMRSPTDYELTGQA